METVSILRQGRTMKNEPAKTGMKKTQILVVDDHPIVRDGLESILSHEPDLKVCGQAEDAFGALNAIAEMKPDIAIVDISLIQSDGIELTKTIKARYPELSVIILSVHDELVYAERALLAGAKGYLMKDVVSDNIVKAIRTVLRGEVYVSDAIAKRFMHIIAGDKAGVTKTAIEHLSDRELETFRLLGEGYSVSKIAEQLHLSVKTIETYRLRIKEKLGLADASELLQYSIQWARNQDK
jgi:DNA-binding NarL/FixJ family response regulator